MERDAVHKAFMSLFRQDTKGNLISSAFILWSKDNNSSYTCDASTLIKLVKLVFQSYGRYFAIGSVTLSIL